MTTRSHLFNAPPQDWSGLVLESVVGLYNAIFPDRLRAVIELGSRTEGAASSISDIDAIIIFKEDFLSPTEMQLADDVMARCQLISPVRLDIEVISEGDLRVIQASDIRIARGGTLVYGEDTRADWWPVPSLDEYREFIWRWAAAFVRAMHRTEELRLPLAAPTPQDPYLGYTAVHRPAWYPADVTHGTKELVATVCWVATALLADAGVMVHSRAECLERLRGNIDDERADLIETVYNQCKGEWDYAIPADQRQQAELQSLCVRSLAFFNQFAEECPAPFRTRST